MEGAAVPLVKRILIVDDEPPLLQLLKRYLERLEYEVDTALDAQQALTLFEADPSRYSCVLTDLSLAEINGEELIKRMREKNAALPALISSGYPYEPRLPRVAFLQKPYMPKMLAEAIEKLLKS